jgi:hypothetical protein
VLVRVGGASVAMAMLTLALNAVAPIANASTKPLMPLELFQVQSTGVVYALGSTGCVQPQCLRLLRTNVTADHFTAVTLPPIGREAGELWGTLRSLSFANEKDGFALVGSDYPVRLYVTSNGARTWRRVTIGSGETPLGMATTASAIYLIVGTCSKNGESCHGYRVMHSPLSANRWTSSAMPIGHSGKYLWGFPYVPAVFGSDVWISEQPQGLPIVFYSRNDGRTFSKLTTPKLGSVNACGLVAKSLLDLWAACPTGMEESFFFSRDGGVTWSAVPQHQFSGTGGGAFDAATSNLAFLDYGGTGPLVRLTMSPRSATTLGNLWCSKVDSSIESLVFDNARDGLAVCLPGDAPSVAVLLSSTDGGLTWHKTTMPSR